jgi:hypothetical protein
MVDKQVQSPNGTRIKRAAAFGHGAMLAAVAVRPAAVPETSRGLELLRSIF